MFCLKNINIINYKHFSYFNNQQNMGVSLTTCYQKNRSNDEPREEIKDIRSSPEEKKLVLRSNPKR